MAGFMQTSTTTLPLSFIIQILNHYYFQIYFLMEIGTLNAVISEDDSLKVEIYGKYIKHYLLCDDLHFHLHPYWPHYSYLK
jgi:hypothetical protein